MGNNQCRRLGDVHAMHTATIGKLKACSRTADFVRLVKGRKVHLPASGH